MNRGAEPAEKEFTFYLDIESPQLSQIPKVCVVVTSEELVEAALAKALNKFHSQLRLKNIQLSLNQSNYVPRLCKRSGKAKLDMPSLDSKQRMFDTRVEAVSIQVKNIQTAVVFGDRAQQPAHSYEGETMVATTSIATDMNLERKESQIKQEQPPKKKSGFCFSSIC